MLRHVCFGAFVALAVGEASAQSEPPTPAWAVRSRDAIAPSLAERAARRAAFVDAPANAAIRSGIRWLCAHQEKSGRWSTDEFFAHDPADDQCTGPGNPGFDTGITALALLALLAQDDPELKEPCTRAADWLCEALDPATGCVPQTRADYVYCQALVTIALAESYGLLGSPKYGSSASAALAYLEKQRNHGKAWRYRLEAVENDASVTSWCLAACAAGRDVGVLCKPTAPGEALAWLDVVTDPKTGQCGYMERDTVSSRAGPDHLSAFPPDTNGCASAALHARLLHGLSPTTWLAELAHGLVTKELPGIEPRRRDFYLWFHTSMLAGMRTAFGAETKWELGVRGTLLGLQQTKGAADGSWNPDDCWGEHAGRVGATAFNVLSLSGPYRLGRHDLLSLVPTTDAFRGVAMQVRSQQLAAARKAVDAIRDAAPQSVDALHCARIAWAIDVERTRTEEALKLLRKEPASRAAVLVELESISARWLGEPFGTAAKKEYGEMRRDPKNKVEAAALDEFLKLRYEVGNVRARATKAQLLNFADRLQKFATRQVGSAVVPKAKELESELRIEARRRS